MEREGSGLHEVACRQFKNGAWRDFTDVVTPEAELCLRWPDRPAVRLLAFPENLSRLALGHAMLELCAPGEMPHVTARNGDEWTLAPVSDTRRLADAPPASVDAERILACMTEFIAGEGRWEATGCFHRAAVWNPATQAFVAQAEDIGRHNCIDRLAGWSVENATRLDGMFLFVSARATASLVHKATACGFAAMVSRSAVTTSGLATARTAGMALAGFAREIRFTVFTDPAGRILDPQHPGGRP